MNTRWDVREGLENISLIKLNGQVKRWEMGDIDEESRSDVISYQEFLVRNPPVAVLVRELEHLADLRLWDVLGQVRHHLPEV